VTRVINDFKKYLNLFWNKNKSIYFIKEVLSRVVRLYRSCPNKYKPEVVSIIRHLTGELARCHNYIRMRLRGFSTMHSKVSLPRLLNETVLKGIIYIDMHNEFGFAGIVGLNLWSFTSKSYGIVIK
jgi:hypothetical protein